MKLELVNCQHKPKPFKIDGQFYSKCSLCEKFLCATCNGMRYVGTVIGMKMINKRDCKNCNATGFSKEQHDKTENRF